MLGKPDEVQKPLDTSLPGFCLLGCSHSLNGRGADFAAGGMRLVRQQIHGLGKASQKLSRPGGRGGGGEWHCEPALLLMQTNVQSAGAAGSPEGPWPGLLQMNCSLVPGGGP